MYWLVWPQYRQTCIFKGRMKKTELLRGPSGGFSVESETAEGETEETEKDIVKLEGEDPESVL